MKVLIVYDTLYGNTEKIARAIAAAITPSNDVKVLRASEVAPSELGPIDLLIVGSPTQNTKPTKAIQEFLSKIPANALKNVSVTSFDTRLTTILARLGGYAAKRIVDSLKTQGGYQVVPPEGFIVEGREGPLKQGELERAAGWAKGILESKK
ncbi:MAG TPA: flavodoxin domain-containing protein [Candidatus Methanoperedens sp.]